MLHTLFDEKDDQAAAAARYGDLVRGKRVVVVGAADTTTGKGRGALIDAYDLVVRINSQWPVKPELSSDIGARTDILYHCCTGKVPIADVPEFATLKFVWHQSSHEAPLMRTLCQRYAVPYGPHDRFKSGLRRELRSSPTTGLIAIAHLSTMDVAELHVTGFSFYSTPYYTGYQAKGAKRKYWWWKPPERIGPHEFERERRYFRSLRERDKRITLDHALQELAAQW